MEIHSKKFYMFIVQVDHLSGECIGQAIDTFYQAGAGNVQVVSAVTKKNRPSYMFFIDCKAEKEEMIQNAIVQELHTGGWHKIQTNHCYIPNEILEFPITLEFGDSVFPFFLEAKRFIGGGIRPEHDSVMKMKRMIKNSFKINVDYNTCYAYASTAVVNGEAVWNLNFRSESSQ